MSLLCFNKCNYKIHFLGTPKNIFKPSIQHLLPKSKSMHVVCACVCVCFSSLGQEVFDSILVGIVGMTLYQFIYWYMQTTQSKGLQLWVLWAILLVLPGLTHEKKIKLEDLLEDGLSCRRWNSQASFPCGVTPSRSPTLVQTMTAAIQ